MTSLAFAEERTATLASWEECKRTLMREDGYGGLGYVDEDIVPLCDALNRLPGVFTLQSCAGHPANNSDGAVYPGALWLRLDQEVGRRFDRVASRLAAEATVERVGKIYWHDGKETVTITFKGNETGLLAESSEVIIRFFEALTL